MSLFKKHLAETLWRLENEPEQWCISQYQATHADAKIVIWHSNRYYGVDFRVGSAQYGGVIVFTWFSRWRHRLCHAVDLASEKQRIASLLEKQGVMP